MTDAERRMVEDDRRRYMDQAWTSERRLGTPRREDDQRAKLIDTFAARDDLIGHTFHHENGSVRIDSVAPWNPTWVLVTQIANDGTETPSCRPVNEVRRTIQIEKERAR